MAQAVEVVQPTSLFSILFSLPTSSSWDKIYSLVINAILLGLVADFLVRPTFYRHDDLVFTRVGAVYNDAAKIVVRYPNVEGGVRIVWKQAGGVGGLIAATTSAESGWLDGPLLELTPEQDWVGTAKLENLWTSTKYECTHHLHLLNPRYSPQANEIRERRPPCSRKFVIASLPRKSYHLQDLP